MRLPGPLRQDVALLDDDPIAAGGLAQDRLRQSRGARQIEQRAMHRRMGLAERGDQSAGPAANVDNRTASGKIKSAQQVAARGQGIIMHAPQHRGHLLIGGAGEVVQRRRLAGPYRLSG
jgi:hypothetical protein